MKCSLIFFDIFQCAPSSLMNIMPLANNLVITNGVCLNSCFLFNEHIDLQFVQYFSWICADTVNVVKMLIANGANVNAVDNDGFSALHWAALNGKLLCWQ